ncbi:DNA (cytosine-5-)-methyltransferase [Corynebacterium alimapuense]|uniref:Cytosine-specific methyltransferase n=1 Tax=Corynebacterium alimapuense TaxID=1576874 RepID=A0A3M8K635_9CORY|nr:DNA (cytosine-5-)-methyltransferase [Corynebacterium alimapuense]
MTDLFAGAGGLTAGLTAADPRLSPFQAVEWDLDAAASYSTNFPEADVANVDIVSWATSGAARDTDVVVGGPPCQGFSTLGRQEENDEKNFLWEQYAQVVADTSPRYFVMENVPQFQKSQQKEVFINELATGQLRDYVASIWTVNTADYGVPQSRKRMIILGSRRDVPVLKLPAPSSSGKNDYRTVRDAFNGLEPVVTSTDLPDRSISFNGSVRPGPFRSFELHLARNYSDLSLQRFATIPAGGNRFDLPDELKSPCWRSHTSGSGDVMGRMFWDRPSVTIRTEFNKPEKGRYLHPEQPRAITHFEATRLMGFPDNYLWVGTKTSIARQIGNAVPLELGTAIGRQISQLIPG